jgi:acyl carrier protein
MSDEAILRLIREALHDALPGRSAEFVDLKLDAAIKDLGISSLATLEMVGYIEDCLGRTLRKEDMMKLTTLRDMADMIRRVGAAHAP